MAYTKKHTLDSLKEGDRVDDIFALKVRRGIQSYAKGHMFALILTDSSGKSIDYKYWGGTDEPAVRRLYESIGEDSVVYVQGRVSSYQGRLQISTNEPDTIFAVPEGEYNPSDFIMGARADRDQMVKLLKTNIDSVENPDLKALLKKIFDDPDTLEKFSLHPGAIEIHHNWVGGLMQYTLEVLEYCLLSKKLFPDLDRDLLVAGSLLHDIGKLQEIAVSARIKGSRKGQLQGHIMLGHALVSKAADEQGTPEPVRDKLLHIIVSHHGRMDYGSPKAPMFSEAQAVYFADELSSKISELTEYTKWAAESTDDEFMYHKRYQRNILLR
jgi:3'-5' exoribonuclease